MIRKDKVFANLFSSAGIIPARLAAFGTFVKNALSKLPEAATYADIIEAINTALNEMIQEKEDVNLNLIEQKGDTGTVKTFVEGFIEYMVSNEMVIGGAMGGAESLGYKAFYPFGTIEYKTLTYTQMQDIAHRVQGVTKKWGTKLPPDMQTTLQGFAPGWDSARDKQQGQISTVQIDRKNHSAAYTHLQLVLTKAVHKVGFENPGDEAMGEKLFPFHLLYAPARNRKLVLSGTLTTGQIMNIMNRKLTPRVKFLVQNAEVNSDICLWLSATAEGAVPASAVTVKAGETKTIIASHLGNLAGTFVRVMNLSVANPAGYTITVSGLPKDKKAEEKETETAEGVESVLNPEVTLPETMVLPESQKEIKEKAVELYQ